MAKYLFQVSYTADGIRTLLRDGGSKRRKVAEKLIQSVGGKIESYYYAFGETDIFIVFDAPDNASAAAASLVPSGVGVARVKTTVLLTPAEMDRAARKKVRYAPPTH